jgi:hypothetical protein
MSAEPVETPQPTCEKCWLKEHAHWEPESVDDGGNILFRLKGVDVPIKHNTGSVESCHTCGELTVAGIYEMTSEEGRFFRKRARRGFGLIGEYDSSEDQP